MVKTEETNYKNVFLHLHHVPSNMKHCYMLYSTDNKQLIEKRIKGAQKRHDSWQKCVISEAAYVVVVGQL
jgi:hypothetical protein